MIALAPDVVRVHQNLCGVVDCDRIFSGELLVDRPQDFVTGNVKNFLEIQILRERNPLSFAGRCIDVINYVLRGTLRDDFREIV